MSSKGKEALFNTQLRTIAAVHFKGFIIPFLTLQISLYDVLVNNLDKNYLWQRKHPRKSVLV